MVKQNYRFGCPLCGSLKYMVNFSKDNVINRILIQSFLGRRKMRYDPCYDVGVLNQFQRFLISRIERIYYRLTGIDIKELILNSRQPLTTKITPLSVPVANHSPVNTTINSPIDIAVYSKSTAKIKAHSVVIE